MKFDLNLFNGMGTWGPLHLGFAHHDSNAIEISVYFHPNFYTVMTTKFYMACAKIAAKNDEIFIQFELQ